MVQILLAIAGVAVVSMAAFGVALASRAKRSYRSQGEVVPGRRSPAPAQWAGAHSPEAKLHRRLGEAVRAANQNPRLAELGLSAQVTQIEAEAAAIDERLVAAAALPTRHRAEAVARFEPLVANLEDAVAELAQQVTVADTKELLERAVSDADIRLRALAEARAEVAEIDRAAGGDLPDAGGARPTG